jgi:hypothetical protein
VKSSLFRASRRALALTIQGTCPLNCGRNGPAGFDAAAVRGAIAAPMSRSKREIPHYYLTEMIGPERALAWLESDDSTKGAIAYLATPSAQIKL